MLSGIKKGSRLEGAVYAESIHLAKGARFRHYAARLVGRPPTAEAGGQMELDGSGSSIRTAMLSNGVFTAAKRYQI